MSYSFEVGTRTVWSPALQVGEIYMAYIRGLEELYGEPAGIRSIAEDMVEIQPNVFLQFIRRLIAVLNSRNHAVLQIQLRAVVIPAVVMLERAGFLDELDPGNLLNEAHALARAMPS